MATARSLVTILSVAIYITAFGYAVWNGMAHPIRNWDMLGYVGSVVSLETADPQAIYDRTMADVKTAVWPELYRYLRFEDRLSSDSGIFYQQLPFYKIKLLYVGAVWLLHQFGAGIAQATWLVSALSFAVLAATLACWKPRSASHSAWLLAVAALCWLGPWSMATLAAYSTPDAFGLMWFMLAFVGWMRWKSEIAYAVCSLLAVLARPDMLLPVAMMAAYVMWFAEPGRRLTYTAACVAAAAGALYVFMGFIAGAYGWEKHFYYSFVNKIPDIAQAVVHLTWDQYQRAVMGGLRHEFRNPRMIWVAAISGLALASYSTRPAGQRPWLWLLLMSWAAMAARFILFPAWGDERCFYSYYLLIVLASLELLAPCARALWQRVGVTPYTARR